MWHPDLSYGAHILGGGNSLACYPPALLLLGLGLSPEGALGALLVLHLHLLGRGTAAAALALGTTRRGALVAATAALLGGHTAALSPHVAGTAGIAWLPALVALTPAAARGGLRPLLALAAAWGVAGLGASPPFLWYAALASLATGFAAGGARGLARAGAAGVLGAALALPALAPEAAWAAANPREPADRFAWFSAGGLSGRELARLLLPDALGAARDGTWPAGELFHETRAPLGAAALALALARLAAGRLAGDAAARVGLALALVGGLLAAPLEPLQRALSALPVTGLFRAPARYLLLLQLGVALLAGSALSRRTAPAGVWAATLLVGAAALAAGQGALVRLDLPLALLGLSAAAAALLRSRLAPLVLVALLLDLGWSYRHGVEWASREDLARPAAVLAQVPAGARILDLVEEPAPAAWSAARANGGARQGAAYSLGYDSLPPVGALGIDAVLRRTLRERPAAFAAACAERSIAFVLAPGPAPPGLEEVARQDDLRLLRVPGARPDAYLLPPGALVPTEGGEVVRTAGLVAAPVEPVALGRTRRAVRARGPGVVVFAQGWQPGWEATVDGAPADLAVADLLLLAVAIGPGEHEVAIAFDDPWVDAGLGLGLACWLALAAAWRRGA